MIQLILSQKEEEEEGKSEALSPKAEGGMASVKVTTQLFSILWKVQALKSNHSGKLH